MQSTSRTTVLNIRFGTMDEDKNRDPFDWANLHFYGEMKNTEQFAGVQVAKARVDASNDNALAKRILKLGSQFPMLCDLEFKLDIVKGEPSLTVVDLKPVKAS